MKHIQIDAIANLTSNVLSRKDVDRLFIALLSNKGMSEIDAEMYIQMFNFSIKDTIFEILKQNEEIINDFLCDFLNFVELNYNEKTYKSYILSVNKIIEQSNLFFNATEKTICEFSDKNQVPKIVNPIFTKLNNFSIDSKLLNSVNNDLELNHYLDAIKKTYQFFFNKLFNLSYIQYEAVDEFNKIKITFDQLFSKLNKNLIKIDMPFVGRLSPQNYLNALLNLSNSLWKFRCIYEHETINSSFIRMIDENDVVFIMVLSSRALEMLSKIKGV